MVCIKKVVTYILEYVALFFFYGFIYFIIECIWKQQLTDWRMAVLGGVMGVMIGLINLLFSYDTDLILQGIVGSLLVTLSEAIGGYYWNIELGLNIWDYSSLPFSAINGQVNLLFSIGWFFLSIVCIFLDDVIDYYIIKQKKSEAPYYVIFGKMIFEFK